MRLVAANASLVSDGRAGRFLLMTALTRRRHGAAAVGAVAVHDSRCSFGDRRLRPHARAGVAARAGDITRGRVVREPCVAALASGVAGAHGGERELLLMTALTGRVLRERELEVMRRVTALAGRPVVEGVIGRGLLMTTAARPRDGVPRVARAGCASWQVRQPARPARSGWSEWTSQWQLLQAAAALLRTSCGS